MDVLYPCCCGLDVHKSVIVACLITPDAVGGRTKEIRSFGTMTRDILALVDWLTAAGCTHAALESTGVYWKPVFNLLAGVLTGILVNAQHMRAVPGRKTDGRDAEWIADLLQHGLLKASFIPPAPHRQLRDLTRYRTCLVQDRARLVNRIHKVLEDTNIKLTAVVTNITGVSARAMLAALLEGQTDPEMLTQLARGRLRDKREQLAHALVGRMESHHHFLLTTQLAHLDFLDDQVAQCDAEIAQRIADTEEEEEPQAEPSAPAVSPPVQTDANVSDTPRAENPVTYARALTLLDTIPGVNQRIAEILIAEVGTDMHRFPSAGHLASWVGICPGNHESAGKQMRGTTRKGDIWLRQALIEAAHGAMRTKDTYLSAQGKRLTRRRGKKKAVVAVAHSILVIAYHVLQRQQEYQDLGSTYFEERMRQTVQQQAVHRLEQLGFTVTLQTPVASA